MNTIIIYATKYGSTEKCASILAKNLDGSVDIHNLKMNNDIDLSKYDKVIIGSSIYIGQIRKEVKEFCENNLNELKNKKTGFYICCMHEGAEALSQIDNNFPKELLSNAIAKEHFGGEFSFDKMNFIEKFTVKMVSKKDDKKKPIDGKKNISNLSEGRIKKFAQLMNNSGKKNI
ncbi:MAG: flavodoxin [Alkaliphilus sp.]|nr:flavodoxin domain-containing protein [bacterium AH-315-L21]MBN4074773.1 flavodoxin domain-containing protein [bacterium AH-315-E09]PHS30124.1 MAG: flavodoxin [Alkaliphilus sp.]